MKGLVNKGTIWYLLAGQVLVLWLLVSLLLPGCSLLKKESPAINTGYKVLAELGHTMLLRQKAECIKIAKSCASADCPELPQCLQRAQGIHHALSAVERGLLELQALQGVGDEKK